MGHQKIHLPKKRRIIVWLFVSLSFFYIPPVNAAASSLPAWVNVVLSRLGSPEADEVKSVIEYSTLERSVEQFRFRSEPAVFEFLLDHPDFAAAVARELRIAHYRITQRSDGGYDAEDMHEDMHGVRGTFQAFYTAHGERIYGGVGSYHSRFLPSFTGHAVVRLKYRHQLDSRGQLYVENHAEVYVRLDNRFVAFFARLLLPFLERAVDQKVNQALTVAKRVSEQIAMNPMAVYDRLQQSPVLDRETLGSFRQLLIRNRQAARWGSSEPNGPQPILETAAPC